MSALKQLPKLQIDAGRFSKAKRSFRRSLVFEQPTLPEIPAETGDAQTTLPVPLPQPPVTPRSRRGVRTRRSGLKYELDLAPLFLGLLTQRKRMKIPPLVRFRSYARLALICVRLCKYSHENVEASKDEYLSIIQVTEDFVTHDEDGIFFDATVYRANKEERLPADARKLLKKDPRFRTDKETDYLHIVLRSIKAFAEYPTKMQRQICRAGWYEAYEPKRAIVRQGQPPHAFYFILSGSVVVTSFDRTSGGTTFLVSLHRGMSFGELAVINRSKRQATVSTGTITELLCISAKDFVDIFMAGGIKSVTDPHHNSFIRRGQVIVRDSNHSDWIYIVKTGSLSVLKKLVEVTPRNTHNRHSDSDSEEEENKPPSLRSFGTWDFRIKKKKRRGSSGGKEVFKNNIEMEKRLEQTLPGINNNRDRLGIIDYDEIITEHKARVLITSNKRVSTIDQASLPRITVEPTESPPTDQLDAVNEDNDGDEDDSSAQLPKIRKTSKRVVWDNPEIKEISTNLLQVPQRYPKGAYLTSMKTKRRKMSRKEAIQEELFQRQIEYDKKVMESQTIGRKTITNELDNKPIKDLTLTEKDIRPMFVQVQVLERGQYFGLTKIAFPEQAETFSLVSNGAECIMISKKLFLEKASEATMHHLRQVETLLPPEQELQTGLQDFVDWKEHRSRVYKRLVQDRISRTERHNQFPPQYGGQYCFRTGPIVRN